MEDRQGMLFSVRDVARILGLHESRVRYWAQTGFINPSGAQSGRRLYTFVDLLGIKAAKELLDRGIPLQRVRKNLQALREAAPQLEQPLNQLRICSDGEHLVVAHREGAFDPLSGQLLLDFEVDAFRNSLSHILELPAPAAQSDAAVPTRGILASPAAAAAGPEEPQPAAAAGAGLEDGSPTTAYGWFLRGCNLEREPDGLEAARAAYERALELDPSLASAHTNLGNLHYAAGQRARAMQHYQAACALDPDQPEGHYNLANLFEEDGDLEMAIAEHRRALGCNPDFADAHFNLAVVLERVGSVQQALDHWQRFLQLCPDGPDEEPWRELARQRVEALRPE